MPADLSLSLDLLIATCDRPTLLMSALESVRRARRPPALRLRVVVLDNSTEAAAATAVEKAVRPWPELIEYRRLPPLGKSYALNTGIRQTAADLIGIIDDDEEIEATWFEVVARSFTRPDVDFIGGPCLPRWMASPPSWLPREYAGVIGHVDDGDDVMVFGEDAPGMLMGGNAVLRRRVFERVGLFSIALGPTPRWRLRPGEDEELYRRLLAAGAHGLYIPDLRIHHLVPVQRLTKSYWRRWCFWRGVARSVVERWHPAPVAKIGAVPRYLVGKAARAGLRLPVPGRGQAVRFADELALWDLAGFLWGLLRPPDRTSGAGTPERLSDAHSDITARAAVD